MSAVSLGETRAALDTLGLSAPVALVETDILQAKRPDKKFDLIVISEVLEHLETPETALRFLRDCITDDGRIFINVPLNSPSPDHIYLFSSPDEVAALVEAAGFKVEQFSLFATQAKRIEFRAGQLRSACRRASSQGPAEYEQRKSFHAKLADAVQLFHLHLQLLPVALLLTYAARYLERQQSRRPDLAVAGLLCLVATWPNC